MKTEGHESYMALALEEASKALGRTSPNPCVGAVIVKEGRVLAKGYHRKAGAPHAEIEALNQVTESLEGATFYVTLEPCSHVGRTAPCCEALVAAGVEEVVVGMTDPNPLVSGRGLDFLVKHGVKIQTGVLEERCRDLNRPFIKYITTGLPWMVMKAGVSLDGRLSYQKDAGGKVTGGESHAEVHRMRDIYDAIMVGANTVRIDDPSLTARRQGQIARDPIRVILDSKLGLPLESRVFTQASDAPTWVACAIDASPKRKSRFIDAGIRLLEVPLGTRGLDLGILLKLLGESQVCSVLVEGGARLHGSLLEDGLFDYAQLFLAPLFAGDAGTPLLLGMDVADRSLAPRIMAPKYQRVGDDMMISGAIHYSR